MSERNEELFVNEWLNPLGSEELPTEDDVTLEQRRKEVVSGMASFAFKAKRKRGRRVVTVAGALSALAAAAAAALWLNVSAQHQQGSAAPIELSLSLEGSRAEVFHSAGVTELAGEKAKDFVRVERITTPLDGSAHIEVPEGAPKAGLKVDLGQETEVHLPRPSSTWGLEIIKLERGNLDLSVPKLAEGTSLSVITPSVRVSVVGTAFSVEVHPRSEQDSCVRVAEGIVQVKYLRKPEADVVRLGAGQNWGCDSQEVAEDESEPRSSVGEQEAKQVSPPRRDSRKETQKEKPAPRREVEGALAPASTLAEEAALLARAVRAEQQANPALAERELQKLLKEYPDSPVATEARQLLKKIRGAAGHQSRTMGPTRKSSTTGAP